MKPPLSRQEVVPGVCVVRWDTIRRIVRVEDDRASWESYDLTSGEPVGTGWCSRERIRRWAIRRATAEEIARLQLTAMVQYRADRVAEVIAELCASPPSGAHS